VALWAYLLASKSLVISTVRYVSLKDRDFSREILRDQGKPHSRLDYGAQTQVFRRKFYRRVLVQVVVIQWLRVLHFQRFLPMPTHYPAEALLNTFFARSIAHETLVH
jgi:hypothetical protein